jgi:sec-independent protein translocase protein TatB
MFEISFPEFALVCIIALLVLGPERLPEALRTLGLWLGRMRRSFNAVRTEIEREIGMDEVRRQLHNETILEDIKRLEREVRTDAAAMNRPAASSTAPSIPAPTSTPLEPMPEAAPADKPNGAPS